MKITKYYEQYHGHDVEKLKKLIQTFRADNRRIVWLAGDSSLDNKHWLSNSFAAAVNGYESVLSPPHMKQDVCYWINRELFSSFKSSPAPYVCINTAVEESCLNSRSVRLLEQDVVIQENMNSEDVLIVSVGGNDIALRPLLCTIVNMLLLIYLSTKSCLRQCSCVCGCLERPKCCANVFSMVDCYCCGSCTCLFNSLCGFPFGLGYFVDLFRTQVETYLEKLTKFKKPSKIIVCMIYFPQEFPETNEESNEEEQIDPNLSFSWADPSLKFLRYNVDPGKLQLIIRKVFQLATCKIKMEGVQIIPMPLFEVLDPSTGTDDYVEKVEPSEVGGGKMAQAFMQALFEDYNREEIQGTIRLS